MASSRVARLALTLACCALGAPLAACDDEDNGHDVDASHDEGGAVGPESGASCPDDAGALTYEAFGQPFMESYCVRCHSSELEGTARNGAPGGHDFDTLAGILLVADHVDQLAAAGPDSENTVMPPDGDKPSLEERRMLGQWLACEQR